MAAKNNHLANFVGQPDCFNGTGTPSSSFWLKTMERIKKVMALNDDEILLIAIAHLRDKARHWWEHTEPKVSTWMDFVTEFSKEYVQGNDNLDFYLDKLKNHKRRKDQSIEELVTTLNNLCDKVDIKGDRYKVRKFVRAMELEKNGPFTSINTAASALNTSCRSMDLPPMPLLLPLLEAFQVNMLAVTSQQAVAGDRNERSGTNYSGPKNDTRRTVRFSGGTQAEQGRRPICYILFTWWIYYGWLTIYLVSVVFCT
ncbi:unnamed protein product [Absidia cylindrospora]